MTNSVYLPCSLRYTGYGQDLFARWSSGYRGFRGYAGNNSKFCLFLFLRGACPRASPLPRLCIRPVARGGGVGGGRTTPPPVAHPKDFVPPFSNFVPPFSNFAPPFSNFVPPFSNFVPPFSNFVPPFSNFVPPFSNFVPPLEYVDDVTRAMSKGGCLWMSKSGGVFQIDDVTRTMSKGGCAWCSTHPSSDPPPPTSLAGYGLCMISNVG